MSSEKMLTAIVEGNPVTDEPICRREQFLKAIANNEGAGNLPDPICREEVLLGRIAEKGLDRPDQSKTVTPTTSKQTITPDSGYELGSVVVNPAPLHSKTVTPTEEQQTITPDSPYIGLSKVIVEPMQVIENEIDLIFAGRYGGITDEQATAILNGTYVIEEVS